MFFKDKKIKTGIFIVIVIIIINTVMSNKEPFFSENGRKNEYTKQRRQSEVIHKESRKDKGRKKVRQHTRQERKGGSTLLYVHRDRTDY